MFWSYLALGEINTTTAGTNSTAAPNVPLGNAATAVYAMGYVLALLGLGHAVRLAHNLFESSDEGLYP